MTGVQTCALPIWGARLAEVPRERRVFLGLQLFPEASMDYWLKSPDMLAHDDVLVRYCEVLGAAGYRIFVKDHPLKFGCGDAHLAGNGVANAIRRLRDRRFAYNVSGSSSYGLGSLGHENVCCHPKATCC